LNATVTPDDATDQNLVWSSSDSSVAEVRGGIVAAKAPGTATITVKSSVWTDVKAQCQITVTDEVGADVPMSEFLLNTSSVTMLPDTTYTNVRLYGYSPFYATDLTLEWTSSDESVVTVEPNGEGDQLTQYV
ncbi:cell adhesion domain-containing protein, partial [human gut metagenome]